MTIELLFKASILEICIFSLLIIPSPFAFYLTSYTFFRNLAVE
jgi:hypothetical protein